MFNYSKKANMKAIGFVSKYGLEYVLLSKKNIKKGTHLTWSYNDRKSGKDKYGTVFDKDPSEFELIEQI